MTQHSNIPNRHRLVGTLCGLLGAVVIASTTLGAMPGDGRMVFQFSRSVALPGVVLPPGAFTFERVNPYLGGNVVRVLNRERTRTYFMGLAVNLKRPLDAPQGQAITFGRTERPGDPPPITAWYPHGTSFGLGFLYR